MSRGRHARGEVADIAWFEAARLEVGSIHTFNCVVNNTKGTCCCPDIVYVYNKYKKIL